MRFSELQNRGAIHTVLSLPFKEPHLHAASGPLRRILFFSSARSEILCSAVIWFPQMRRYSNRTKQIYARRVNGLKYNGDIAAEPTGINHINSPFIFVQQGNICRKAKQDKKIALLI